MYPMFTEDSQRLLDKRLARVDARVIKSTAPYYERQFVEHIKANLRKQLAAFLSEETVDQRETEDEIHYRLERYVLTPEELSALVRREAMRLYMPSPPLSGGPAND